VRSALLAQFLEKEPARGIRLVLFSDDETTGRATLERVLGLGLGRYAPLWRASTLALRFP